MYNSAYKGTYSGAFGGVYSVSSLLPDVGAFDSGFSLGFL